MKRSFALVTVLLFMPSASADVYVKVDANGNAIGEAIVCEQSVCGDSNSDVSKALLKENEKFVLQGSGTVGINNHAPDVNLKHEAITNEWVITRKDNSVERFTTIENRETAPVVEPVYMETTTVTTETKTATIETSTVLSDSATVTSVDTFDWDAFWLKFETLFRTWLRIWGRL